MRPNANAYAGAAVTLAAMLVVIYLLVLFVTQIAHDRREIRLVGRAAAAARLRRPRRTAAAVTALFLLLVAAGVLARLPLLVAFSCLIPLMYLDIAEMYRFRRERTEMASLDAYVRHRKRRLLLELPYVCVLAVATYSSFAVATYSSFALSWLVGGAFAIGMLAGIASMVLGAVVVLRHRPRSDNGAAQ